MRRTIRRLSLLVAATLTLSVVAASPASAITGGEPDGNRHPNVALIVFYAEADASRYRCTATLISPTVLITAAHCTEGVAGSTLVTFESVIAEAPPSPLPAAADPSVGYTPDELAAAGYLSGTSFTHPQYSGFTDLDNWNDVGVVVLDQPVTNIAPATIAPQNYLDEFAQPQLNRRSSSWSVMGPRCASRCLGRRNLSRCHIR